MEGNGQSRLYITNNGGSLREQYPVQRNYTEKISGQYAKEILDQMDFYCVNSERFLLNDDGSWGERISCEWGCYDKKHNSPCLGINRLEWEIPNDYSLLVKALEAHTGRTGLIIIVS
jgi:hypothetical protein